MNPIDEITLQAYVDGELDVASAASIDAALAQDDLLARRVHKARELRAQLNAAFDPVLVEPVPAHLAALLHAESPPAAARVVPLAKAAASRGFGADRRRGRRRWFFPAVAVAASIAVLSMAIWWQGRGDLLRVQEGQQFASGALSQALDQTLASEPDRRARISIGLTFRSADGDICRTFVTHAKPAMAGLACHQPAGWSVPALSTAVDPQSGDLRQSASALPPRVQAAVDARLRGDAFTAKQERVARDAGWQ
ncbi:MAG: hypothetical protein ABIU96_00065 [Rhodanobacter sp.]